MQTGAHPPTLASSRTKGAHTGDAETVQTPAPPQSLNATGLPNQDLENIHHLDGVNWELNVEDLSAGLSLSGSKALLDEYPDDETTSKKTKKPKPGKGTKGNNKSKREKPYDDCRPVRG